MTNLPTTLFFSVKFIILRYFLINLFENFLNNFKLVCFRLHWIKKTQEKIKKTL